ncbi:MAG: hypothetical protein RIR34_826 [Actinomycetota bacterium]|jgi:hypothetical protein
MQCGASQLIKSHRSDFQEKDSGNFSVIWLATLGAGMAVILAFGIGQNALIQRQKLQLVVDQAAVSADGSLRGLNVGFPCEVAKRILQIDMARLQTCSIVGEETRIAGSLIYMGIVLSAEAWSAPKVQPVQQGEAFGIETSDR